MQRESIIELIRTAFVYLSHRCSVFLFFKQFFLDRSTALFKTAKSTDGYPSTHYFECGKAQIYFPGTEQ